tara:strand:- start:126 stop:338 length:213 start_codon:yes stop_codon:yes gene_type:complete
MLDADTLRPVVIAMALQLVLFKVARNIPPTGVGPIDNATSMLIANGDNITGALVLVGVVTLAATIINESL